jgi:hypothetical protein
MWGCLLHLHCDCCSSSADLEGLVPEDVVLTCTVVN